MRDDLGPSGLVALALAARAGAQQRLAGHVHPELGRVEHLIPRMSYSRLLPAPSGSLIVEMLTPSSGPFFLAPAFCRRKSS